MSENILLSAELKSDPAFEQHFSVNDIAKIWGVSRQTITRWFKDEPGVMIEGKEGNAKKRGYHTLRIPASVVRRVHRTKRERDYNAKLAIELSRSEIKQ